MSRTQAAAAAQGDTTPRLARQLGLFDSTMLVMGGIVGAGLFINPYVVAERVHSPVLILAAWIAGGIVAMLGAFVYAELAARMPDTGGEYAYLRECYHPIVGFLFGWVTLLVVMTGGMAAVAVTFARYFLALTGLRISERIVVVTTLAVLTLVNCLGAKLGSRVQSLLMVMKIVVIAGVILSGVLLIHHPFPITHPLLPPIAERPSPLGLAAAFGSAMIPVLFAYGGWQTSNYIASEIRDPRRNLTRALMIGVAGVIILYVAMNAVCVRALGAAGLALTKVPATAVMQLALGDTGAKLVALGIAVSTLGFLSQSILTGPRVYFAMARDGLFFRGVARVTRRTQVPAIAIVLQSGWTAVIALSGSYEQILNYVVSTNFIFFGLSATCLFLLRRREAQTPAVASQQFRAPGHPWTTLLFIAACWLVVMDTIYKYPANSLVGLAILLLGLPVYAGWRYRLTAAEKPVEERERMKLPRPYAQSVYMQFAKQHSSAKYNLATSGVMSYPLLEIHFRIDDLEINGPDSYGHTPLLEAIAQRKDVTPENVVLAAGTSMANHLAMSALFAPGEEVLIEEPAYELLTNTALYLGAKVRRFLRRAEDNFQLDPEEVRKSLTPQTRLIVLTNMHNPSSTLADRDALREIGEIANSVGARVLVDEVYLEALHHPPAPTSFHLGPHFVVTSSLTKAYGLSGLRCGWILAEPELAERIWRLNDLFAASPVHIAELLSVFALEQIDKISRRADRILEANRAALTETLANHPALDITIPPLGTTAFPRFRNGDVHKFCDFLRDKYETAVVPGIYFERPEHFRIGLGGDIEMTREGLTRLAAALHAW